MDTSHIRAQVWLDAHERDLDGVTVDEAVALIAQAGLQPRVVAYPPGWMTQEQQRDRVNVWLDAAGAVHRVNAG